MKHTFSCSNDWYAASVKISQMHIIKATKQYYSCLIKNYLPRPLVLLKDSLYTVTNGKHH